MLSFAPAPDLTEEQLRAQIAADPPRADDGWDTGSTAALAAGELDEQPGLLAEDGDVVSVALASSFGEREAAARSWDVADPTTPSSSPGKEKSPSKAGALPGISTDLLDAVRLDAGSSRPVMVACSHEALTCRCRCRCAVPSTG